VFGRRTGEDRVADSRPVVDRDADGVDDRAEPAPTTERRDIAPIAERRDVVDSPTADQRNTSGSTRTGPQDTDANDADLRDAHERGPDPRGTAVAPAPVQRVAEVAAAGPAVRVRGRTSIAAVLSLILGLSGLYAALSGRLAPVGLVLSALGLLVALGGVRADRPAVANRATFDRAVTAGGPRTGPGEVRTMGRRAVTGGGLASFAMLISLAGVIIAVLALNHTSTWLDSDSDQPRPVHPPRRYSGAVTVPQPRPEAVDRRSSTDHDHPTTTVH
jgi:hypothetical protein